MAAGGGKVAINNSGQVPNNVRRVVSSIPGKTKRFFMGDGEVPKKPSERVLRFINS